MTDTIYIASNNETYIIYEAGPGGGQLDSNGRVINQKIMYRYKKKSDGQESDFAYSNTEEAKTSIEAEINDY